MSSLYPQPGEKARDFFEGQPDGYHLPWARRRELGIGEYTPERVRERADAPPTHAEPEPRELFRVPRPYVQACARGTLASFYSGGRVSLKPLMCRSWSCEHCRKSLAARTLDRLRRGMSGRSAMNRMFVTLTINPLDFGAVVTGSSYWTRERKRFMGKLSSDKLDEMVEKGELKRGRLVSEPTLEQFTKAKEAMVKEFKRLCDRLNKKATRAGFRKFGYFRITELHRNGWPHFHIVFEHEAFTTADIQTQLDGWNLGKLDARDISLEDAVGEVAPYLSSKERKGNKGYQFAAHALPKNARLYTASQGFLAPTESVTEKPEDTLTLRGHFTTHYETLKTFSEQADLPLESAFVAPPPAPEDMPHKPLSGVQASGDAAVVMYSHWREQRALTVPVGWCKPEPPP